MYHDDIGNHEAIVALREALTQHPELTARCAPLATFEECLAEIAAYCNIILDGAYNVPEILKLCDILARKLNGESALIIPVGFDPHKRKDHIIHDEIETQHEETPEDDPDWETVLGDPSSPTYQGVGSPDVTELISSIQETVKQSLEAGTSYDPKRNSGTGDGSKT